MNKDPARYGLLLLSAFLVLMLLSGCNKSSGNNASPDVADAVAKPAEAIEDETSKPEGSSSKDEQTRAEDTVELSDDIYAADSDQVFSDMADWSYMFSSGAGGWATELTIKPDGSFYGVYHDSEMGSTGPGYEYGTVYYCAFSGHFDKNVRMAGPLMYNMTVADIKYENEPDTDEIKDSILYKYTKPYGFEDLEGRQDALVFMDAGAVISAVNEEEMMWLSPTNFGTNVGEDWDYVEDKPEELPFAALINTVDHYAFFSTNISDSNRTFLINKVKLPGLRNTVSVLNDDGTYRFVDESTYGRFKVINSCFELSNSYSLYFDANGFVDECLRHIYGSRDPVQYEVYVTSPGDVSYSMYDKASLCGLYSCYAFWYPSESDRIECEARFAINEYNGNGKTYAYVYMTETGYDYGLNGDDPSIPDTAFSDLYLSSLTLTGRSDSLSSASKGKGAVKSIKCNMKVPDKDSVMIQETSGESYQEYKLAAGRSTPFYVQHPSDGFHKFFYAYDISNYINRNGFDDYNSVPMCLYLNSDDEIVYGYEIYTP